MIFTVKLLADEVESNSLRDAAEQAWFIVLTNLLNGSVKFEITNSGSDETCIVEMNSDVSNDSSLSRYLALVASASKFMGSKERAELEAWEAENLDGRDINTSDWEGWEKILGTKPPKKFRRNVGIDP